MPFRDRAKALFRPKSRNDSLSKTSSKNSSTTSRERWPSNVYKPGEPMPRLKYRRPPTKEHKEKLEAFSFADAWRRKSYQSTYSPGGTRVPSRAPSRTNSLFGRKSFGAKSSRANSFVSSGAETEKSAAGGAARPREYGAARQPRLSTEAEAEGDDDVGNVGLSRVQSRETKPRPQTTDRRRSIQPYALATAHDHEYFSEHDLALALQRSHLAVPAQ